MTFEEATEEGLVFRVGSGVRVASLPVDLTGTTNFDYDRAAQTINWTDAEGNPQSHTITQAEIDAGVDYINTPVPSPVPQRVSPKQFRMALNQVPGLRAQVEAAVAAADQNTQDAWEYATNIQRDDAYVIALGSALGLSTAEIDDIFRAAAINP